MAAVGVFLKAKFSDAVEIEAFGGNVKYRIGMQNMSLAEMFEIIEAAKASLTVTNYAISQTTLEQVFIAFASDGQRAEAAAEAQLRDEIANSPLDTFLSTSPVITPMVTPEADISPSSSSSLQDINCNPIYGGGGGSGGGGSGHLDSTTASHVVQVLPPSPVTILSAQ